MPGGGSTRRHCARLRLPKPVRYGNALSPVGPRRMLDPLLFMVLYAFVVSPADLMDGLRAMLATDRLIELCQIRDAAQQRPT